MVKKLARDTAAYVGEYALGEIAALSQRCYEVLAALSAEADDAEDRQRKYERRQAVLNLVVLSEALVRYHTGKRKPADLSQFRVQIADALQGLV